MSPSTADRILDSAEEMAQRRGFHDFSFREIAAAVGVKSASVHYHYPTKEALGVALVRRYRERFTTQLERIESESRAAAERLAAFAGLFRPTLEQGRLCLCGALGAERGGLPAATSEEVSLFFRDCELWLSAVLETGVEAGELTLSAQPSQEAFTFLSLLEGAMMVARNLDQIDRFDRSVATYLASLQLV